MSVIVPSYRGTKDIECEADLIEEIGRIIGYDNIDPLSPTLNVKPVKLDFTRSLHRKLRNLLSLNSQAFEVITYPLVGEKLLSKTSMNTGKELRLVNALSKDHDRMRLSLIPSLLEATGKNAKNFQQCHFYEIGKFMKISLTKIIN